MATREAGGLGPENQKRLLQTFFFMPNTDLAFIRGIIEKLPNRWTEYAEFLAWAIIANKKDVAEFLIADGASLTDPPHELSSETYGAPAEVTEALRSYRRTPFLLLAAAHSSEEMVQMLVAKGAQLSQTGFVGTSRARLNAVLTSVLGAAVFHGKTAIVRMLLEQFRPEEIGLELQTSEERGVAKSLSKEYSGCTPLLLAVHRLEAPDACALLLRHGANAAAVDWQQNNALHLAASLHRTEMVRFFDKTNSALKQARNARGETAFSIAKEKGFRDILEILGEEDQSKREADELIQMLGKEEQKKAKKPRNKKKPVDKPKPVDPPVVIPEKITVQETETPKGKTEELTSLMEKLRGKSSFTEMNREELAAVEKDLRTALETLEIELSSRK